jgi:hypothetical protein
MSRKKSHFSFDNTSICHSNKFNRERNKDDGKTSMRVEAKNRMNILDG